MATENRELLDAFYDRLQTLPALVRNLGMSIAEAQRSMDQGYIESLAAFTKIISIVKNNVASDAVDVVTRANDAVSKASNLGDGKAKAAAQAVADAAHDVANKAAPTPSADAKKVLEEVDAAVKTVKDTDLTAAAAQLIASKASDKLLALIKELGPSQAQYLELFRAIAPSHYQFTETAVEVRADLRVASQTELAGGIAVGINTGVFSVAVNFSMLKRSASDYQASASLRCVINAIPADHTMLNDLFARAGSPITASFKADASFKAVLEAMNELKQIPAAPALPPAPKPLPEKPPEKPVTPTPPV